MLQSLNTTSPCVGIINYSTGNIASITNSLLRLGVQSKLVSLPSDARTCDALILPGVGHFETAICSLVSSGLDKLILDTYGSSKPLLAICLGFQILTQTSEESPLNKGLSIFPAQTVKLKVQDQSIYKVPHIGWNTIYTDSSVNPLFSGFPPNGVKFYFSNKYGVKMHGVDINHSVSTYLHQSEWISSISHLNYHGVQFHPEKSGSNGQALLLNFIRNL